MRWSKSSVLLVLMCVTAVSLSVPASASVVPKVRVLSSDARLVSGGNALVRVIGLQPMGLRVLVGSRDVTGAFAPRADGRILGVVDRLPVGASTITARGRTSPRGPNRTATLRVVNHPKGGPVFSGAQIQPWLCGTPAAGLGAPVDDSCNAPTKFTYRYKSSSTGEFEPYDPANPPSDVALTTTDTGAEVPYIMRTERGTMNRGIYELSVLADPAQQWEPWASQRGWNRKLVWNFGGGTGGMHSQGKPGNTLSDGPLARGFMVADSGLTVHSQNAQNVVGAETIAMVKEHIAETYGPIRYTIGQGCSGGGLQQHVIAATYPGLLDGLLPACSFPDIWTTAIEVADCFMLAHYFNEVSPHLWAVVQQRAVVEGHDTPASCLAWNATFGPRIDPKDPANCGLPAKQVYHPETNPTGARCGLNDYQAAIWGPRPEHVWGEVEKRVGFGFAKRPIGNVGAQYGLRAFNDGLITAEQFVDLNEKVGGIDIDGDFQAERTEADPGVSATAYRTGQITNGRELARVPIIDLRGHDNDEIHTTVYSYITRERLKAANGTAANQAIWLSPIPLVGDPAWACGGIGVAGTVELPVGTSCSEETSALLVMDRWLAAIEADDSGQPLERKVIANRPRQAVDSCWIAGRQVTDMSLCEPAFGYFGTPRMVAGQPLTNDIIQCALKPLDADDYAQPLTAAQLARLEKVYPSGVCDYRKPGVDQQPPAGPWFDFSDGPGGRPMTPTPAP